TASCLAPVGLVTSNIASNSATIAWNLINGAIDYTIQYRPYSSSNWITLAAVTANAYSITGLSSGTTYEWQVKASCSAYSLTTSFTTLSIAASKKNSSINVPVDIKGKSLSNIPVPLEIMTRFSVYPNPAQNSISLMIGNEDKIEGDAFYQIVDFRGRIRKSQKISGNSVDLEISDLEPGPYIIQMVSKLGVVESKTMIKE
uniref:T9SS type A sorting domain-containing protein n=1 Tax=Emticicia sp. TaxID=1930953 RepID=UPI003BA6DA46